MDKIKELNIDCSTNINWNNFDKYQPGKIEQLAGVLAKQNIRCLSKTYLGFDTKVELECLACGNIWKSSPEILLRGVGCPHCKHNMWTMEQAQNFCLSKQIILLDKEYSIKDKKYCFQCKHCSNLWSTKMQSITEGHGCPKCSHENRVKRLSQQVLLSIEKRVQKHTPNALVCRPKTLRYSMWEIKNLCESNGWIFLSQSYRNRDTNYKFRCQKCKNDSITTFGSIKRGLNCPKCSK